MILGDPAAASGDVTIENVFRHLARLHPDALALIDPADRPGFTDGEPRRLTFAEADRVVSAIAGRLRSMGLPTDAIVGIQLPNVVENFLTMLGVWRAGMVAAPLPLLWRRADTVMALARIGARALITCGHVGAFDHARLAMQVAAEVFAIRYLCAFGQNLPDGVIPFDDLFAPEADTPLPPPDLDRQNNAAAHVAAVTFDVGQTGPVAVARSHSELLASGLTVLCEARLGQNANILSALEPASFAGLSLTLLPWLLSGGTLVLHQPFTPGIFDTQRHEHRCAAVILPAPIALRVAEAGGFAGQQELSVIAAWRLPEQLAASATWHETNSALIDVSIFGEVAVIPARRDSEGRPIPVPLGRVSTPRDQEGAVVVAETLRTDAGTLAMRGPMVPHHVFPPGIERSGLPHLRIGPGGAVDTGYACRVDAAGRGLIVTGPPPGIISVGGYRFPLRNLQNAVSRIDQKATLAALPDPLLGQHLIGNAEDRGTMQAALDAVGVNPLVVAAFADRSSHDAFPEAR